jgi:hypothetical protein
MSIRNSRARAQRYEDPGSTTTSKSSTTEGVDTLTWGTCLQRSLKNYTSPCKWHNPSVLQIEVRPSFI